MPPRVPEPTPVDTSPPTGPPVECAPTLGTTLSVSERTFVYDRSVRPDHEVHQVFQLHAAGLPQAEIARRVGVARATVRDWLLHGESAVLARPMRRSRSSHPPDVDRCSLSFDLDAPAYAYTLGQYLGDGCVSMIGRSFRLRIACCAAYPDIIAETAEMVGRTIVGQNVGMIRRPGYTEVYATSLHWPCLVPHGPGKKHLRPIELTDWQREIALEQHPERLLRGLIHSDGCRCINRVRRAGRSYEYPRYFFTNKSPDIRHLFLEACERLDIDARPNNRWSLSVARRDAVEKLDRIVGPKT
jgi:hypothetical protein